MCESLATPSTFKQCTHHEFVSLQETYLNLPSSKRATFAQGIPGPETGHLL